MQTVSEVMTRDIRFVSPQENLQRAAQMMDELNVGALPVCEGDRLVGIVTDRDITVRATAAGRAPNEAHVEEVMSTDVRWVFEDQPIDEVLRQMADTQIRRVPVVSHDESHKLIGIVSLGDLATMGGDMLTHERIEQVVGQISTPSEPDRSSERANGRNGGNGGGMAAQSAIPRRDTDEATGSDTGTASGLAGSDMTDVGGGSGDPADAIDAAGVHAVRDGSPIIRSGGTGASSGGTGDQSGTGSRGVAGIGTAGGRETGVDQRKAGSTDFPGGAGGKGDPEGQDLNRNTAAPGGIDAAGAGGASGGTAGTAGSSGTGVGAKP